MSLMNDNVGNSLQFPCWNAIPNARIFYFSNIQTNHSHQQSGGFHLYIFYYVVVVVHGFVGLDFNGFFLFQCSICGKKNLQLANGLMVSYWKLDITNTKNALWLGGSLCTIFSIWLRRNQLKMCNQLRKKPEMAMRVTLNHDKWCFKINTSFVLCICCCFFLVSFLFRCFCFTVCIWFQSFVEITANFKWYRKTTFICALFFHLFFSFVSVVMTINRTVQQRPIHQKSSTVCTVVYQRIAAMNKCWSSHTLKVSDVFLSRLLLLLRRILIWIECNEMLSWVSE